MSVRLARINKHIQRTFGEVLQREAEVPAGILVTVSRVDTAANLKSSTVWLYISPLEQAEDTMASLKKQMYGLQALLNKELNFKPLPRINLRLDQGAVNAQNVEKTLAEIKSASEDKLAGTS